MISDVFHLSVVKFSSRDAPLFRPLAASESKDAVKVLVQPACFEDKSRSCQLATCLSESFRVFQSLSESFRVFHLQDCSGKLFGACQKQMEAVESDQAEDIAERPRKSAAAQGDEEAKGG